MSFKTAKPIERIEHAARPCLDELPYRMVVYARESSHGVPLYLIAGSSAAAMGAKKALREAHKLHGGVCFYCRKAVTEITIDHIEPVAFGGSASLQNLAIACKPCNARKGNQPIEAFKPEAGREWLEAVHRQIGERLARLTPPSPRPPKPGATGDP